MADRTVPSRGPAIRPHRLPGRRRPAEAGGWAEEVADVPGGKAGEYRVDALHAELVARGVVIDTGPVDQTWGNREMYVKDPDGNSLRFIQEGRA
jgi:catechol 2,3-dioxygenase-like lactoylglutathione lyase family enzyme